MEWKKNSLRTLRRRNGPARDSVYTWYGMVWYAFDANGNPYLVNISIGCSYAQNIYGKIQAALQTGNIFLTGCGDGRKVRHRLNWYMRPTEVLSTNIFVVGKVVGSKVKGLLRDATESVHVLATSDEFNLLSESQTEIFHLFGNVLHKTGISNQEAFQKNIYNPSPNPHHITT